MSRLVRFLALVAAVAFCAAGVVAALPGAPASAVPALSAASTAHTNAATTTATTQSCTQVFGAKTTGDSWAATEPLERHYFDANGAATTSNCFKLTVNKHTDLQDHERITVTWSGAHVTDGRSLNPYGESGLPQEYPVLLMECRGVDPKDGAVLSGAQQVAPDTCWTNTYFQRTNSASPGQGVWEQDADSTPADDTEHIQGIDAGDIPASCNINSNFDYLITPFVAEDGTLYAGCSSQSMPPEATVNSVSIPNEVAAFTNTDGTGTFPFEVRTSLENQSLGCSSTVPCTLEVIPIDGIDCDNTDPTAACNQVGDLPAGGVNPGSAPADAVAPAFWASASNWNRRIPVPLSFAPPPSVCSIASAGKPVPFYGSELLDQAALQWTPAYCLNKKRFNWQDNVMPDDAAFTLMQGGQAAAAEVSSRGDADDGVGYAPTAATGWAIAFNIDKPGNAGQQMTINLDARLLAKLLTESYPGSIPVSQSHPGFAKNPLSLNLDPEFIKLNPNLDTSHWSEAAATLLATSTPSAVMDELTSYIASDPQAMAFLAGKPDPWGMRVNPYYKNKVHLPVSTWPLLDTWQYKAAPNSCLKAQGDTMPPYMPLIANPQTSLQLVAQAMLYNWPNVETGCTGTGTQDDPYQLGRVAPQGMGNRFMLGLVTVGDAQRYGLTTASLQAAPGHYVGATDAGMRSALALATKTSGMHPFDLTQATIRTSTSAYPGTMVVYTAAKTSGLSATEAKDVSQFIKVSSTEGQKPGRGNGQLAAGYVPIADSGVTKALYAQAQQVAAAVAAQKAPSTNPSSPPSSSTGPSSAPTGAVTTPPGSTGPGTTGGVTTPGGATPVGAAPSGSVPSAGPSPSGSAPSPSTAAAPTATTTAATEPVSSTTGGVLLLVLIGIGVVAAIGTVAGRIFLHAKGMR